LQFFCILALFANFKAKHRTIVYRFIARREGRVRRGVRLPDALHGQDVRLQEAGEEADQEATRRDHGHHREADPTEGQLTVRRQPRLRLRDEGRSLPG
jgi:hypothetical protein